MSAVGDSALAFFLPQPVTAVVDLWRMRYDPRVNSIAPHITVAFPPFITPREWPTVRAEVIACVAGMPSFEVTIQSTGTFNETPLVLWLRPEDDGHFVHMHQTLAKRFPQYVPVSPIVYVPHGTIGFFEDLELLLQAQHTVEQELKLLRFKVNELCLGSLDMNLKWQLEECLPLGAVS